MNYTKFGTRWGVSGQYIGRLARRKILPTIGGKIHVAKADETMKIQGIRGQRKEPLTSGDAGREMPEKKQEKYALKPNLYEAKAQHEILKSELTELELRKNGGSWWRWSWFWLSLAGLCLLFGPGCYQSPPKSPRPLLKSPPPPSSKL